jgi:hypothetical protein
LRRGLAAAEHRGDDAVRGTPQKWRVVPEDSLAPPMNAAWNVAQKT